MKKIFIIYLTLSCALCTANDAGKLKSKLSELRLLLDWYDNTKTVLDDEIRKHDLEHDLAPDEALHMRVAENMRRINRIEEAIEHCIAQLKLLIPQLNQELIKELFLLHDKDGQIRSWPEPE